MARRWTNADAEAAKELGFGLFDGGEYATFLHYHAWVRDVMFASNCAEQYEREVYLVDLYVWFLADAGEPTAAKALDIIQAYDPIEFASIVRTVMKATCNDA